MPLKIRCPHCRQELVAQDAGVGQTTSCAACGQTFQVPLPPAAIPPDTSAPRRVCPRCGVEIAPLAAICHRCLTDLVSGRRLPLRQRWRHYPARVWAAAGSVCVLLIGGALTAWHLYRINRVTPDLVYRPPPPQVVPAADLAALLLTARDPPARGDAVAKLEAYGPAVAEALGLALTDSLRRPPGDPARIANQLAAIDLLSRWGSAANTAGVRAALTACDGRPELRAAALRARGLIGDATVREALAAIWIAEVRRAAFLARLETVAPWLDRDALRTAGAIARRAQTRAGDGLRSLAVDSAPEVFAAVLAPYWESWSWLGQARGDALADAVFELARPPDGALNFRAEDVRRPRDILRRVGQVAAPETRAAAGLTLLRRGPQYRSVCAEIATALGAALGGAPPSTQQRLTWTIAVLRGKLFGNVARDHPLDVTAGEVAAALVWAGLDDASVSEHSAYPEMPTLTWRARTARGELERVLLAEFARGWSSLPEALDRWRAAGLGSPPAVRALLDPAQRAPQLSAIVAALVIVAEAGDGTIRPQLEHWAAATDQPDWLRAMAYTVLGSLDAGAGTWDSGWPAGLALDPQALDRGGPGWELFGRIIAAGGPAAIRRLEDSKGPSPPAELRARLIEAARRAAAHRGP